jgi:hypothetical protein
VHSEFPANPLFVNNGVRSAQFNFYIQYLVVSSAWPPYLRALNNLSNCLHGQLFSLVGILYMM